MNTAQIGLPIHLLCIPIGTSVQKDLYGEASPIHFNVMEASSEHFYSIVHLK